MNATKPIPVNIIAWTTLASGIVNLFWGFAASGTLLATVIGIFCIPITILPTFLGIFELIYAAKLFSDPPQVLRPSTNIAVLEIACLLVFNVFSMAVGILALVFYNDKVVKEYFTRLNSGQANANIVEPVKVTDSTSASLPDPEPDSAKETNEASRAKPDIK